MICNCTGDAPVKLIYTCSGSGNTGYLSDRVARGLEQIGLAKMACLAALAAGKSGFIESAKAVDENIVIDGCPASCGKQIFEQLGIPFTHVKISDYEVQRGKTEITEELVKDTEHRLAMRLLGLEKEAKK